MYIIPVKQGGVTISSHMARSDGRYHQGLDLICQGDQAPIVIAAETGVVAQVGFDGPGYGHFAIVRHSNNEYTLYGHMAQPPVVQNGKPVSQGQDVGIMGSTGASTGRHLHFEIVAPPDPSNFWSANPRWQYKKNPFREVPDFHGPDYGGEPEQTAQTNRWIQAIVNGPGSGLSRADVIARLIKSGALPSTFV